MNKKPNKQTTGKDKDIVKLSSSVCYMDQFPEYFSVETEQEGVKNIKKHSDSSDINSPIP